MSEKVNAGRQSSRGFGPGTARKVLYAAVSAVLLVIAQLAGLIE